MLERLRKYNPHLKMAKCEFLRREVVYLGLKIDAESLHPVEEKVDAVKRAPVPQKFSELRSFLGMVQYYHPFLPDLATTLAPLHELLKKGGHGQKSISQHTKLVNKVSPVMHFWCIMTGTVS